MTERDTEIALFVDYDNLLPVQKAAGMLDIVRRTLMRFPLEGVTLRSKCSVRVYGGWYEGSQMTRLAQDIAVELQRDFPCIIRVPRLEGTYVSFATTADLAVATLQEPGHHVFNTYRRKGKPSNVRVEDPATVGCNDPNCLLPLMRKLLRRGSCPKTGCTVTAADLIYRDEQKIVDTMLCCDLLHAGESVADRVILVSGDDDFLPPLRTLVLRGAVAVRYHTKPNSLRASFPPGAAHFTELDL